VGFRKGGGGGSARGGLKRIKLEKYLAVSLLGVHRKGGGRGGGGGGGIRLTEYTREK